MLETNTINYLVTFILVFCFLIVTNFLNPLLHCHTQRWFTQSPFAIHILAIIMIYFLVTLSAPMTEIKSGSPLEKIPHALLLWIFFIFISRIEGKYMMMIITILLLLYTFHLQLDWYKKKDPVKYNK